MQLGGTLAQFGPPAEILSNPASDFVARFVGSDRGLKRLSLTRVVDVEVRPALTVRTGDDAAAVRQRAAAERTRYVLLVDERDRPIGWIPTRRLEGAATVTADHAESMSPGLEPNETLKDALGRLLDAGVETGIVVDERGAVRGLLNFADFGEFLREDADTTQ
jgi:osmoprotectant transport system ATP-binding protein